MKIMTDQQAYAAMFHYLKAHYDRTKSNDLGAILGDMSLLEDDSPADPATTKDWEKAVTTALAEKNFEALRLKINLFP